MEKTDVPFLKIKQYISDPLSFSVPHPLKIFEIIILRDKLPKTGVTVCMYASLNYPAPDAGPASDAPPPRSAAVPTRDNDTEPPLQLQQHITLPSHPAILPSLHPAVPLPFWAVPIRAALARTKPGTEVQSHFANSFAGSRSVDGGWA